MCVFQYDSLLQLTTAQTADEINTILDDPKFMAVISSSKWPSTRMIKPDNKHSYFKTSSPRSWSPNELNIWWHLQEGWRNLNYRRCALNSPLSVRSSLFTISASFYLPTSWWPWLRVCLPILTNGQLSTGFWSILPYGSVHMVSEFKHFLPMIPECPTGLSYCAELH